MDYASILRTILQLIYLIFKHLNTHRTVGFSLYSHSIYHGHFKEGDHLFPAYLVNWVKLFLVIICIYDLHKLVSISKFLLMEIVCMFLEVYNLNFGSILTHEEENISTVWIPVELMLNDLHQSDIRISYPLRLERNRSFEGCLLLT